MIATPSTRLTTTDSGKDNLGPLERVHLLTADDQLPVQVRPGDTAGGTLVAQYLAGRHVVAHFAQDLRLMPVAGIHTPAMINHGGVAPHGQFAGENHHASGGGGDRPVL